MSIKRPKMTETKLSITLQRMMRRKRRRQNNPKSIASSHVDLCALICLDTKKHIFDKIMYENTHCLIFFPQNVFDCCAFVFLALARRKNKYILMLIKRPNMMKNKQHCKG
jgi:hypothetical protein